MTLSRPTAAELRDATEKASLTDREREVLLWTAHGKTAPEAATIMGVSANTVGFHLKNTCRKLDANNKTKAAAIAIDQGLIVLSKRDRPMDNRESATLREPAPANDVPRQRRRRCGAGGSSSVDQLGLLDAEIGRYLSAIAMMDGDWESARRTFLLVRSRIAELRRDKERSRSRARRRAS